MKALDELKGVVLKAIAKDIKLPGYSRLNTEQLRTALKKAVKGIEGFDISKYMEAPEKETGKAPGTEKSNVVNPRRSRIIGAAAARRTVAGKNFGRR